MRTEEEAYLQLVIDTANRRLEALREKLDDSAKDLESMNDYFWENYAEFDEYGYEMYDNRMALKTRLTQHEEYTKEKARYEKMMNSPYFGRVDFCYEGEDEPEVYYIGIGNLAKEKAALPIVYDWRAPVSSLFYDYDQGPASFEAPMGTIRGDISRKRMYKIQKGKLIFCLETEMNIDDEILQQALAEQADARLKSIVNTIQKEQNKIIRDMSHRICVVQGCAGSGKTSVALHRIAYMLYHNRKTLQAAQILVLSPNSIFGDYISRILPELGEENICEMTLDDYAYRELRAYGEAEDRYDEMERVLHGADGKAAKYKLSKEWTSELDGFILQMEWDIVDLEDFRYKRVTMSEDELSRLFYEKFCDVPILDRMDHIAEVVIDQQETLQNKDMDEEEQLLVKERMNQMYRTKDILALYNEFLAESGREDQLLDGVNIPYEDVYSLLYLKYSLNGMPKRRKVKHLVIDEMQDYSYLQYRILAKMFDCPMTILGDKEQTMDEKQNDVCRFLSQIYGKDVHYVQMNKSYRSTSEIMEYAAGILPGKEATDCVGRHGNAPAVHTSPDYESMTNEMLSSIKAEEDYTTLAVLCLNQEEAGRISKRMKTEGIEHALLNKSSMRFTPGITVMPFYLAKGLEFDKVYVPQAEKYTTGLLRQAMYINATRALHDLKIYQTDIKETV